MIRILKIINNSDGSSGYIVTIAFAIVYAVAVFRYLAMAIEVMVVTNMKN